MTIMTTRKETPSVPIKVLTNLKNMEMEIHFASRLQSPTRVAYRAFRFCIALDDKFTIWQSPPKSGTISLILHVTGPPWYSKQLKEAMSISHVLDSRKWSIEDTWARQTDIVDHKNTYDAIDKTPISLRKNLNSINIARWTTFRVNLKADTRNLGIFRTFCTALRDFNVEVLDGTNFRISPPPRDVEAPMWSLLDANLTTRSSSAGFSLRDELSHTYLPFEVRYQLEVCLSHGWLSEYAVDDAFLRRLSALPSRKAKQLLVQVAMSQQQIFKPMDIFERVEFHRPVKARKLPENCVEICHATVTATGLLFHTPSVEVTNRVIRQHMHYADRFLRVRFEDDAYRGQSRLYSASNRKMDLIFRRVRRALSEGIILGDRHYEFLAWGNSQLREHGVYFFATVPGVIDPQAIRERMGNFDAEKVVAKLAARMGQCFSTTRPVHLRLPPVTKDNTIPDVVHGKYTFTDGVGKISVPAAGVVHSQLRIGGSVPSALQFRLGGCKGVLAVDPHLPGVDVKIRPSQLKFDSLSGELEIIRWSEFWQCFLNRQLVLVLSSLGVPDEVFLRKQDETIQALDDAMVDDTAALKALRDNVDPNRMTLNIGGLVTAGFRQTEEPFATSLLLLWRAYTLKYLKEKAKIPVRHGAFVLGCVDETATLRGHFDSQRPPDDASQEEKERSLPEVFIQITDPHTGRRRVIEEICIIARNPSLHRGDIRVVKAVNVPRLHHLCDVLVMPQTGDRDLASMCSGGDLDGDDYLVMWDKDLIPPGTWHAEPFHYEAPTPVTAGKKITTNDIINFFHDYLRNDSLGRIAHAHLGAADFLHEGIQSEQCLELVHLHSMAVDYSKTGVPAIMPRRLERVEWPHFMQKKGTPYTSRKVLGRLFDAVERIAFVPDWDGPFDVRILNSMTPPASTMQAAKELKEDYDQALQRIMAQHQIRTEFEVWSTFVLTHSKAARDFKFHEEIGQLSRILKEQFYESIVETVGGRDYQRLAPFAVAAYQYTKAQVDLALDEVRKHQREKTAPQMPFISFPWILQDTLAKIATSFDDSYEGDWHSSDNLLHRSSPNGLQVANRAPQAEFDGAGNAVVPVTDAPEPHFPPGHVLEEHWPDPIGQGPAHIPSDSADAKPGPSTPFPDPRNQVIKPIQPGLDVPLRPRECAPLEDVDSVRGAISASLTPAPSDSRLAMEEGTRCKLKFDTKHSAVIQSASLHLKDENVPGRPTPHQKSGHDSSSLPTSVQLSQGGAKPDHSMSSRPLFVGLDNGIMKDPMSMTAEERQATGIPDDDDLL